MVWYQEEEYRKKTALAEMLKGGVIMDVSNVEQAKIAEEASFDPESLSLAWERAR